MMHVVGLFAASIVTLCTEQPAILSILRTSCPLIYLPLLRGPGQGFRSRDPLLRGQLKL